MRRRTDLSAGSPQDLPELVEQDELWIPANLAKRIDIPCCNDTSPAGLVEASTVDPWRESDKYALAWVYFSIILLVLAALMRCYYFWNDKIRTAAQKERTELAAKTALPESTDHYAAPATSRSTQKLFLEKQAVEQPPKQESSISTSWPLNASIAVFRYVFYRPLPIIKIRKGWRPLSFPPLAVVALIITGLALVLCYTFVPQPLYWQSMRFGSPPVAIRAGMLAIAMMPWIIATAMKASIMTTLTGIGHERLNVLHRWAAYICMLLSLIHAVPFYVQAMRDRRGSEIFHQMFALQNAHVYGTGKYAKVPSMIYTLTTPGIAALVPLLFLCVHSLPPLRRRFYELFVVVHVPVSIILLGMLLWHCRRLLTSWHYLFATVAIWVLSYLSRLFYLNWTNPWRMSWLVGEEAAVTLVSTAHMHVCDCSV